jgi:transketolase
VSDLVTLQKHAARIRIETVRMAYEGKTPHVASALSEVEFLAALYFRTMAIDPSRSTTGPSDDRFILSKGHGCISYYATLAERGFFPRELLRTYAQNGSPLAEHPSPKGIPGVEVATGSLGHGLSIGVGAAIARRLDQRPGRVFVMLSDGECNEGSVWEAAMFAGGQKLDRLTVIVDYNKLQAMGRSNEVSGLAPLADKFRAFGFATRELDGNSMTEVVAALDALPLEKDRPTALVAHTVKGKGVSFMEDNLEWHYRPPSAEDFARAQAELEVAAR